METGDWKPGTDHNFAVETWDRPQFRARRGDTVLVHSIDRLARNLDDLRRLVQTLTRRGVRVVFVKEQLTVTGEDSPLGHLMLSITRRARACQFGCGRGHRFDPVMVAKTGLRSGR